MRIDAAGGLYGLGEAYMGPGLTAILDELCPLVVGAEVWQIEEIARKLHGCTVQYLPKLTVSPNFSRVPGPVIVRGGYRCLFG